MSSRRPPPSPPPDSPDAESGSDGGSLTRSAFERMTAFETVLIAGGVVLFLALLYQMQVPTREDGFLNPPLVGLAGGYAELLKLAMPARAAPRPATMHPATACQSPVAL